MKVTPTMRAEFERRRLARESCETIAAGHPVTPSTVSLYTRHLRVRAKHGARKDRRVDYGTAAELADQGVHVELLAERYGVMPPAIYRALRVERRGYA